MLWLNRLQGAGFKELGKETARHFVARRLAAWCDKMLSLSKKYPDFTDMDDLHEIRIKVKRFRYVTQTVDLTNLPLDLLRQLKQLQDVLGLLHDDYINAYWARGIALQQPEDYLPWGLGAGQSEIYLIDRYNEVGLDSYANMRFHAHCQYLEELMETGFVGLALLLLALIAMPVCANGKGRQTGVILITIFGLNMAVDCMFGLFCGIALWAVGMVFISLLSPPLRAA